MEPWQQDQCKYPDDLRSGGIRMVPAHRQGIGQPRSGVAQVAQQLVVNAGTLRNWINVADSTTGATSLSLAPGPSDRAFACCVVRLRWAGPSAAPAVATESLTTT